MDVNARIARRVRALRDARGLSLEALADRSGVSRSNISLIERSESSPTAAVLDKLAAAFGVTLGSLFEDAPATGAASSPLARAADQTVWTDPASGYVRRNLSPAIASASALKLVHVLFPPGKRVAYDSGARDIDQQIWILEGAMEVTIADERWRLEVGDCLAMRLDRPIVFRNRTRKRARYLVALANAPTSHAARTT